MFELAKDIEDGEERRTNYLTYFFSLSNVEPYSQTKEGTSNIVSRGINAYFFQTVEDKLKKVLEQKTPILNLNIVQSGKNKEPDIVEIDYAALKKFGLILISERRALGLFRSQKVTYRILRESSITSRTKILSGIPVEHRIELDRNNNRVRICGKNVGKTNEGEWKIA